MGLASNVMCGGFSSVQAQAINGNNVNTAVTAAGTTQATAKAIVADGSVVTAGGNNAGVILYNGEIGDSQWVFNSQLTNLKVYPFSGGKINQVATNGAVVIPAYTYCRFQKVSSTQVIGMMSA